MFEDLLADPGGRACKTFYVLATLSALAAVLKLVFGITGSEPLSLVRVIVFAIVAGLAFLIGRGIENRRPWSKWVGYGYGILTLFGFPIGTLVGILIILLIYRAAKAGVFSQPAGTPVVFTTPS